MMETIAIKESFNFLKKSKIKANEGKNAGLYPFYTSSNILSKYRDEYEIENEALIFGTGGNASVHYSQGLFSTSTDCFVIQSNNKYKIVLKYVYYFLSGKIYILENGFKGAGLKHISKKYLENIKIPLPSIEVQKKIVEVLDKAQEIIDLRKRQIEIIDELIESLFYQMFGDPMMNSKGWNKMSFSEFSESRLGKMLDRKQINGMNLKKYLGNANVQWFHFNLENLNKMDFNEDEVIKFSLREGDILICEGGEIGRCAIWKNELEDCYFQKALHRVRVNKNIIYPEYLQYVMWFYSKCGGFKDYSSMATIAHLTGIKLKKMIVPVPPIDLQKEFADKLKRIQRKKELMQQSLFQMENNFKSLIQKAFNGDLFREA